MSTKSNEEYVAFVLGASEDREDTEDGDSRNMFVRAGFLCALAQARTEPAPGQPLGSPSTRGGLNVIDRKMLQRAARSLLIAAAKRECVHVNPEDVSEVPQKGAGVAEWCPHCGALRYAGESTWKLPRP